MDIRFSDEQRMVAEAVETLLRDHAGSEALRRQLRDGTAIEPTRWRALAEMGLCGALAGENAGGMGLAPVDFVLVAEACGHAVLPEPLVEHAGVAVPLLADLASTPEAREVLREAAEGRFLLAVAHPANPFVTQAQAADALIVIDASGARLARRGEFVAHIQESADPFRRLASVEIAPGAGIRLADAATTAPAAARAMERGAVFAAAQLVGVARRASEAAVAYAKERRQFDRPIGANQAVKHRLAEAQVRLEFARPVAHVAAACCEDDDVFSRARVSHAKLAAADAADFACRAAVQVHGAMGYSWEVDVHLFLKRAIALTGWWGDAAFHRARVAARVFGAPLGPETTFARGVDGRA